MSTLCHGMPFDRFLWLKGGLATDWFWSSGRCVGIHHVNGTFSTKMSSTSGPSGPWMIFMSQLMAWQYPGVFLLGHWGSLVKHTYVYKLGTIGSVSGSSPVHHRAISGNNFRVFVDLFPASFLCEIWIKIFLLGKLIWKYRIQEVVYFVQASIC